MIQTMTTYANDTQNVRNFLAAREFTHIALVAEDDPCLRTALMEMLDHLGIVAVGVEEGGDLWTWVEPLIRFTDDEATPDLIISDLMMPGVDALAILRDLSEVRPDVPVVVVSGVQDQRIRDRVAALGYSWIDKPIVPDELEAAVLDAVSELQTFRSRYEPPSLVSDLTRH